MNRVFLVCIILVPIGCARESGRPQAGQSDPLAAATMFAVADLRDEAPEGMAPYLASMWQIPLTSRTESIPAELLRDVREATGLPIMSDSLYAARDSLVTMLWMFRPKVIRPDSILLLGGWMGFTGGDGGGAWGSEYQYLLDCSGPCRLLAPRAAGSWN